MSKMKLYNSAEHMYIYDNISIDEICNSLNVSRRTLFYWKKRYNWDLKYKNYINTKNDFNNELISFTENFLQILSKSIDNKNHIPSSYFYTLMNLIKTVKYNLILY